MILARGGNAHIQWEEEVRMADGTMCKAAAEPRGIETRYAYNEEHSEVSLSDASTNPSC